MPKSYGKEYQRFSGRTLESAKGRPALRVEVFALWATYAAAAAFSLWLARRLIGPFGKRAALLLAAGPLLLTGKAMLLGRLYGPADLYYAHEPWSHLAAQQGVAKIANPILSDLAFANLPWRAAVREALAQGRLPFWNRFVLGGTPLLAAAQAAVFHPSTWLGIFLPLSLSWTFSCAFTLFLALLSGFLFFRDFRLSEPAALLGAAGWGFSTYVVFWDGWSVGASTAAAPLLLLGLRRLARGEPRGHGMTVTASLLALAGGHPESVLHVAAAGLVFFAWELAARPGAEVLRALARAAGAGALAILLSGPQLFPLLEAIPHSSEYRTRRDVVVAGASKQSVPVPEAARRLLPAALPFAHGIYGKSPVQTQRADGSGMPLAYAGALLFPLAALAFRSRGTERGRSIFLLFLLAGLLAGASAPGLLDLLALLPGFSMALNYRLVFLAGLGLAGLAAFGAESLRQGSTRAAAALAAGCAALLCFAFLLSRKVFAERGLSSSFVVTSFALEVAPLLLFAAFSAWPRVGGRRMAAAALLLLAAQRGLEMSGTYPALPSSTLAPPLAALEGLAGDGPARLVALGDTFRPNAAALYRLEDVRGYESIVLDRLADTFPLWCRPQFASFNRVDDLSSPFLSLINARYAMTAADAPVPPPWRPVRRSGAVQVLENPRALPRAFVPKRLRYETDPRKTLSQMRDADDFSQVCWIEQASAVASAENADALLELRAVGPDLVVAAQASGRALIATSLPAWPGWRAVAPAGELPIVVVNQAFVGFWIPPGRTQVRLSYVPRSFRVGLWAFALGVAMAAATYRKHPHSRASLL